MAKSKESKTTDVFDLLDSHLKNVDAAPWEGTFKDYLPMVIAKPQLNELSHSRILRMIESQGVTYEDGDEKKERPKYNFFSRELFGLETSAAKFVNHLKAASTGSEVSKRILLVYGPTSSGKSQTAILIKRGLEAFTKTAEGAVYAIADCPQHENPMNLIPHVARSDFRNKYGIHIEGELCPVCSLNLREKYNNDIYRVPVKRIFFSEKDRVGIGTFLPGDQKSQDISELVGSIDLSTIGEYGTEADPRAYKFNGELNVANRGMMEMIEMLKVDPKFLYVLLTLAQEKNIKTGRFPLIYADEFIFAHSVVGDSPMPYRKNGKVHFATIAELTEKNDTDIEVIGMNLETKTPEWTKVKAFYSHTFNGKLIKTIQKDGVVETTYNHSIYSTDYQPFYPEDKKNLLAIRQIPSLTETNSFAINLPEDAVLIEDRAFIKTRPGSQGNGLLKRNYVKAVYNLDQDYDLAKNLLTTMAWYITEGHINDDHCIISQANTDVLNRIKKAAESISSSTASLQDRSDKQDGTSRLHLSTEIWKKIMQVNCGKYSDGKKIPDFVFNLPLDLKMYFFDELLQGDGTRAISPSNVYASDEYREKAFRYTTTSKMLAAQVGFLASQLGLDYSVFVGQTVGGKEAYFLRYRKKNLENVRGENKIETLEVQDMEVYDIECVDNHSFVCGVGNVVCHNTNETEFEKFLGKKELEALHDRMIVLRMPYNLKLDEEQKIYDKLIKQGSFSNVHIAPNTLLVASMFAVLSRLTQSKNANLTLMKKLKLYNGEDVEGFTKQDLPGLMAEDESEGMSGISPRYIINRLSDCFTKHNVKCINPIDAIRSIKEGFDTNPKLSKKDIEGLGNFITMAMEEYNKLAKREVKKAFFVNFENEINNLLSNYIDNVEAYLDDSTVTDEWGERKEPNERLMRAIEEAIEVTSSGKDSFREEVYRKMVKSKAETGKYDLSKHTKLREALETQLFNERADVIKMTVSSRNPDENELKKKNQVVKTLIDEHHYCNDCANQLLRYVNSIMSR